VIDNGTSSTSLSKNAVDRLGLGANVTRISGVPTFGANLGRDKNRLEWINNQYAKLGAKMQGVATELLNEVALSPIAERRAKVKTFVERRRSDTKPEDIEKATNNLISLLAFYPPEALQGKDGKLDANLVETASRQMAEVYTTSWKNAAMLDGDGKWYFGGAGLSVQFVAGFYPLVSLFNFKRHNIEGHKETKASREEANNRINSGKGNFALDNWVTRQEWNQAMLDDIVNRDMKLSDASEKVIMENGYIKIPKTIWGSQKINVVIDAAMKGKVKQDEQGNLLLSPKTPLRALLRSAGDNSTRVLNIGADSTKRGSINIYKD
jgi:hypothetical protein